MTEHNRLSVVKVNKLAKPGRHSDGQGLYLDITAKGGRSWVLLFRLDGRMRELGLGSASAVGLKEARQRADAARAKIRDGIDPIAERRALRAGRVEMPTFRDSATEVATDRALTWRNERHTKQWMVSLETHAATLMPLPVNVIDTSLIINVLRPMTRGPDARLVTAKRVLNRIEAVLAVAIVRKLHPGPNPAIWRGNMQLMLPVLARARRNHHAALAVDAMPSLYSELKLRSEVSASAARFTLLTAARSGEVRLAVWNEVDLEAKLWSIPGERMKSGRPHRVPLSPAAIELLEAQPRYGDYIFPGRKRSTALSAAAFGKVLTRLGRGDITLHGSARASFRTWAAETYRARFEVAEAALAHRVGDATVLAYARSDYLEERRALMEAWGSFLAGESGADVIPIRGVS